MLFLPATFVSVRYLHFQRTQQTLTYVADTLRYATVRLDFRRNFTDFASPRLDLSRRHSASHSCYFEYLDPLARTE